MASSYDFAGQQNYDREQGDGIPTTSVSLWSSPFPPPSASVEPGPCRTSSDVSVLELHQANGRIEVQNPKTLQMNIGPGSTIAAASTLKQSISPYSAQSCFLAGTPGLDEPIALEEPGGKLALAPPCLPDPVIKDQM